jgi:hypothetical protein
MPGSLSSVWLLRANDPVYLRAEYPVNGVHAQRPVRCPCGRERGWLIVADDRRVVFVCGCGRRQSGGEVSLRDVVALVEAVPVRPDWVDLDDALHALSHHPRKRPARTPGGKECGPACRS